MSKDIDKIVRMNHCSTKRRERNRQRETERGRESEAERERERERVCATVKERESTTFYLTIL